MKYGGSNNRTANCPRCARSIGKHAIKFIESNDETEKLAKKAQDFLSHVVVAAAQKGFKQLRVNREGKIIPGMVGAATARIGSTMYKWVTISGADTEILGQMANLGGDVTVIKEPTAAPLRTILGKPLVIAPPTYGIGRDFPVGACAAQKLVMAIFNKASETKAAIDALNMAEILWSNPLDSVHNRDWSTGSVVCSCDTCKHVLPAMLCDHEE